ncbi:DUF5107 domain-containing protein [Solihabitans fulvus]|uniref:DUF5107 domain-containing protein n=1 Tax=Solihabitans fulvus TaxID=1892852 RepID=A0A5B2WGW2_9PSEU|nr:DUF5107 domain-containing protein [Solihabitans fulvus]KAA2251383.1 DUF5107 domain-containing protein [Solihabitans fulvus]
MTSIRTGTLTLPVSPLGPPNPLPPLAGLLDPPYEIDLSGVPADLAEGARYGHVRTVFPYSLQDDYGRAPRPTELRTVVLENDALRATFLPDLGGRLWSLRDKAADRELLHVPALLQPANLALRNAWFAGGVEWNIGTRGHSPTTCAPLHAALLTRADGTPVLRMWEWERLRGVLFHVDAWLPEGSSALLVGVRIDRPGPNGTPMYWWSNTAVRQTPTLRVLAPSTRAFRTSYGGALSTVDIPEHEGHDTTYPGRAPDAADYFHDLPADAPRPWIAAVDEDGHGLAQASTSRLRGRKLFCWGESTGGRRWQRWLGGENAQPYCEIQAGLARTQYEHLPMPADADWSWVEAYGPVTVDPSVTHGPDWSAAVAEVAARLEETLPDLDRELVLFQASVSVAPTETVAVGSGWGALEQRRRAASGEPPLPDVFPEATLGAEQHAWLTLLETGELPETSVSYVDGANWVRRLAAARPTWATAYHLGVIAHAAGDLGAARQHYVDSLARQENASAWRALALVDAAEGRLADAADRLVAARALLPEVWQLAVECLDALLAAGRADAALALLPELPPWQREHGRVRLLEVRAALADGDRDRAAGLLRDGVDVHDLREGEVSLDQLWSRACPDEPLPARYDFRMHG